MEVLHLPANQCTRIGVGDDHWQPANVPRLWRRLDAPEVVGVARSCRVDCAVGVIPLANDHVGGRAIRTYTENMQSDRRTIRGARKIYLTSRPQESTRLAMNKQVPAESESFYRNAAWAAITSGDIG